MNEDKETNLILECLNYLVEKLIKRHYECITGLSVSIIILKRLMYQLGRTFKLCVFILNSIYSDTNAKVYFFQESFENINLGSDCNSQITTAETNSENTSNVSICSL